MTHLGPQADGDTLRREQARACSGRRKDGSYCKAPTTSMPASDGQFYCWSHHIDVSSETKTAAARRGNLVFQQRKLEQRLTKLKSGAPDYATAQTTKTYLEHVSRLVQTGQLAPSQASVICQLAGLAVKIGELELERSILDAELQQASDRGGRR